MIENIQSICVNTAYACAAGVGMVVAAYGVARGMKFLSGGVKCLAAASLVGTFIIGGMTVTSVRIAGAKTNDTNQIENGEWIMDNMGGAASTLHSPLSILHSNAALPVVTDDDIAAGWRVISVSSNVLATATFTMPTHATVWESAQACGRGWGAWHIPIGGWQFTYGDDGWTNAFVWVEGYFRSKFRSRANEIRLLSERLALCPAAHWSRYNLAASRAWCATNDVDGLVVTFENAAIGDDPTKIASVQMELFPRMGEVALRYDIANVGDTTYTAGLVVNDTNHFVTVGAGTREVVFQRVHPDDWDMDGLPNSIDDNPRVPSPNTGYNQTDAWAMAAFPSNSAEIATMGYAAWVAARAAEPNRHLIGLQVSSPENVWPICLTFGEKQMMCDGSEMLYFAIDDGARYSFELSDGALAAVDFDGSESLDAIPVEWYFPWEYRSWPCMVTLHVDSARTGWIGRTAEVSVDGLDDSHFFPNGNETVTAVVTNCHEDAYIDCTWIGGEGISFSDNHSLSTTIYWNSTNGVAWATNYVDLVTTYEGGYAITNRHGITIGLQTEPTTDFSIGCQKVFFLNDADFLEPGDCPTNRPERIRPVTLRLVGARGTGGYVSIVNEGVARAVLFQVVDGVTNRIDSSTRIRIGVGGDSFTRESEKTIYMSCPTLGRGTLRATWTPDDGNDLSGDVSYQVIEPIRKLVNADPYNSTGPIMNPSRLVYGTNAILKVSVNLVSGDAFSLTNALFRRVSGPGEILAQWRTGNDWYARVAPTSVSGEFVVEARFNDDEPQPQWTLPIVASRVIPVRVVVVDPPAHLQKNAWMMNDIREQIKEVNDVFAQVGYAFGIQSTTNVLSSGEYWNMTVYETKQISSAVGEVEFEEESDQFLKFVRTFNAENVLELYYIGDLSFYRSESGSGRIAMVKAGGVFIPKGSSGRVLAHELGHVLGLDDIYMGLVRSFNGTVTKIDFPDENKVVGRKYFSDLVHDWGRETGCGFYERNDSLGMVAKKLLMLGVGEEDSEEGCDIPFSKVYGMPAECTDPEAAKLVLVGAEAMDPEKIEENSR